MERTDPSRLRHCITWRDKPGCI